MAIYYQTIAYAAGTISFLLALLLIGKKKKIQADYFLLFLMLTWGIIEITILLNNQYQHFPILILLADTSPVFIGQILYFYVLSLTQRQRNLRRKDILHLIPALLYLSISSILGIHYIDTQILPYFLLRLPLKLCLSPIYVILALHLLQKFKQNIKGYYADIREIDLAWLRILLIGVLCVWTFFWITEVMLWFMDNISIYQNLVMNISVSIFIVIIGFLGVRNTSIFLVSTDLYQQESNAIRPEKTLGTTGQELNKSKIQEKNIKKYEKNQISAKEQIVIQQKLLDLMQTQKPFLDPKLSIQDLSELSGVSSYKVSQVLNANLQVNFYDFINRYRIEYFQEQALLAENQHLTLFAIAEKSGFASKSSFNRIHKYITGRTPSQFIKNQIQK